MTEVAVGHAYETRGFAAAKPSQGLFCFRWKKLLAKRLKLPTQRSGIPLDNFVHRELARQALASGFWIRYRHSRFPGQIISFPANDRESRITSSFIELTRS